LNTCVGAPCGKALSLNPLAKGINFSGSVKALAERGNTQIRDVRDAALLSGGSSNRRQGSRKKEKKVMEKRGTI